jgi:hypothetical protein
MVTEKIDAYDVRTGETVWVPVQAWAAIPSRGIVHPPFQDPRAKKLMTDLYETFKGVDDHKSSPEKWEERLRESFTISQEVALWIKIREVFSKLMRGHWNDRHYVRYLFTFLVRVSLMGPEAVTGMEIQNKAQEGFILRIFELWAPP